MPFFGSNLKINPKAILFASIFFVIYLLIAIASFFGCCTGITTFFYDKVVWILVGLGFVVFGFCFYNNCYKKKEGD